MHRKTSLFVLSKDVSDKSVTSAAEAAREQEAYLACLLLHNLPNRPYLFYGKTSFGAAAMPSDWVDQFTKSNLAVESRAVEINDILVRSGSAGDVQCAVGSGADIRSLCAQRAMSCDIAELAEGLRKNDAVFRDALHGLLFQSPIGAIVNSSPFFRYSRIFVAWNSSVAKSRAVHAALSYCLGAQKVVWVFRSRYACPTGWRRSGHGRRSLAQSPQLQCYCFAISQRWAGCWPRHSGTSQRSRGRSGGDGGLWPLPRA